MIYATGTLGGCVAHKLIGYQRSILLGSALMATGLFTLAAPDCTTRLLGLALVIVGDGLFKPNISFMAGQLYGRDDPLRDRGFTLFYMGIHAGAFLAPLVTGWLVAATVTLLQQNFKLVFLAAGVGLMLSFLWFWFRHRSPKGVGRPAALTAVVDSARGQEKAGHCPALLCTGVAALLRHHARHFQALV